jgi:uncharacterized paraquat-inducible protein A
MPWCEECEVVVADDELGEEGECPKCSTVLVEQERRPFPWYFKFLGVATVIYLIWRAYQGINWLAHHA